MKKLYIFITVSLQGLAFAQAPNISYSTPQTYMVGTAITPLTPIGGATVYNNVTTIAGKVFSQDGISTVATFYKLYGVATDVSGNIYVSENNKIRKITPTGTVSTVAGNGTPGSTDGTATVASFSSPQGVAVDASGNIYVADTGNNKIRKISPTGVVSTFAGSGQQGSTDETGAMASFNNPRGIAVDASGNVYVADSENHKIRKINPAGVVSTFAGSGTYGTTDGAALTASFTYPIKVAVDAAGNLYITDQASNSIRKITSAGIVSTLAGNGTQGTADGPGKYASFYTPEGIAVDASGNVYVSDSDHLYGNKIRKITPTGFVSTFAGSGNYGYIDDTGKGASFKTPLGLAVDVSGNVLVADFGNNRIRKITPQGVVSTFSGSNILGSDDATGTAASFYLPFGVAVDTSGNVYVADTNNHKIRKITPAGEVSTFAGSSSQGSADGTGTAATFTLPQGVATDSSGNIYVSDFNNKIRKITPLGIVSTLAGSGTSGYADGTGTAATFRNPNGMAVDGSGNIYVADTDNNRIRKITSEGVVSTLAGSGLQGFNDGIGTAASFYHPNGITVDISGNIYVADSENNKIRKISSEGIVSTLAGNGIEDSTDGTGTSASFGFPRGITVDALGNIYASDTKTNKIRKITPTGVVSTLAGGNIDKYPFADGIGTAAVFNNPVGVAVDVAGNIYVADSSNHLIRKINSVCSYTVSPELPLGLSINSSTGIIYGTSTSVTPPTTYTVTSTNVNGSSSFNIVIGTEGAKPVISYLTPQTFTVGTAITSLNPTNTGSPASDYSITPSLPSGLNFDTSTGVISGMPTVISAQTTYTVTANNSYGTGTTTVVATIGAKPNISYTTPLAFTVGTAITALTPTNTGSPASNYSIIPSLPTGVNFDTTTGVISGTPTVISAQTTYTVTANNSYGTGATNVIITIGAKPNISYTTPQNFTVGTAITSLNPTNTGSPASNYSIAPTPPAGLNFDTTTGVISGTPTVISTQTTYTVTATNNYGTSTANIVLTVNNNLGIEDIAFKSMVVYPNPTTGEVNINNILVQKVNVYNNAGQLVKTVTNKAAADSTTIQLNDQPSSIYYMNIETKNGCVVRQVIKK